MPFANVKARFQVDGAPIPPQTIGNAFYEATMAALQAIYDGSSLARAAIDSWLASNPGNIQIQFLSGAAQGIVGAGIVQIDNTFFQPNYYISTTGNVVADDYISGLTHELGHAVTTNFDNDSFTNLAGDNVLNVNNWFSQLGYAKQASYESYATGNSTIPPSVSYTDGKTIKNAIFDFKVRYVRPSGMSFDESNVNLVANGVTGSTLIVGSDADNNYTGTASGDWLYGNAGSDVLDGDLGDDFIYGGGGADTLTGGDGADVIYGGDNPSILTGIVDGADSIDGGIGDDRIYGGAGNDVILGGSGNDYLAGEAGSDSLYGGDGNDVIIADIDDTLIDGGGGYDTIDFSGSITAVNWSAIEASVSNIEKIVGSDLDDNLTVDNSNPLGFLSTSGVEIHGGIGNDVINADDAPNMLWGDTGNDTIDGKAGDDIIEGGDGNDTLIGGDDSYVLASDNDTINGGAGNDTIHGGAGADDLSGDSGNNYISGGAGNDTINSTGAADVVSGDGDNDLIKASGAAAEIHFKAGDGKDLVETGDGAYQLVLDGLSADDITFIAGGTDIYSTYYLTDLNVLSVKINSTGETITFSKSALHGNMFNGIRARDGVTLVDYAGVDPDTLHNSPVDSIKFADGSVWSASNIWDYILDYKDHSNVEFSVLQPIHNNYYGQIPADRQVGFGRMMADFASMQSQSSTTQGTLSTVSRDPISYINDLNATYFQLDPLLYPAGDVIVGTSYDEGFEDGYGNDDLTGGQGNDGYSLSFGDDTIRWSIGDGNDIAYGARIYGGNDTLVLGAGIAPANLQFAVTPDGNGLVISFANTAGSVTLANELDAFADRGAFGISFHDGTIWTHDQLLAAAGGVITAARQNVLGTSGADVLYLPQTNFTVQGLAGDDLLSVGGDGHGTIVFAKGDGHDTLSNFSSIDYRDDTLSLTDIQSGEVVLTRDGDSLTITVAATGDSFTAENQFTGQLPDASLGISQIAFADGTTWDRDRIAREAAAIRGDAGNNVLTGTSGADILVGGAGNDTLIGGGGDDIYRYALGDGSDIVDDYGDGTHGSGGTDVIQFAAGIAPGDVTVAEAASGSQLVLTIAGGGSLTLNNEITFSDRRIDQVTFADGTSWSYADMLTRATTPTAGNDIFYGDASAQTLSGGAGNDTLFGRNGNDRLVGGTGNDTLNGGNGNDVYAFAPGDGQDLVVDARGTGVVNAIELGAGITPGDVYVTTADSGHDIVFGFVGSSDKITVDEMNFSTASGIDEVRFADSTVWSYADIMARRIAFTEGNDTITGTSGNETLFGSGGDDTLSGLGGNDVLAGGTGNDTLVGGAGDDVYRYGPGDGADIVDDYGDGSGGLGGTDVVKFAAGIAPGDVTVAEANSGTELVLTIAGGGSLTLKNEITFTDRRIDQVTFADGTSWSYTDMLTRATTPTAGNDVFYGDANAQTLSGGAGDDTLFGRNGNDILIGGTGNDILNGGNGTDSAYFAGLRDDYQISTTGGVMSITDLAPTVDGDDGTDQLIGIENLVFKDGTTVSLAPPVVLDLDGDGVTLTPISGSTARFDLNGDGVADKASWIGSGDAFLFLDRNHDGTVSNAGELSFIDDKPGATSDLAGLAAFDTNGDGSLSTDDADFQGFGLWRDANGNGLADSGEVFSLADAGIAAIGLGLSPTQSPWSWDTGVVLNTGTFTRADGSTGSTADVVLSYEAGVEAPLGASGQNAQVYARQLIESISGFDPGAGIVDGDQGKPLDAIPFLTPGRPVWGGLRPF